jgi:hypothetical protein
MCQRKIAMRPTIRIAIIVALFAVLITGCRLSETVFEKAQALVQPTGTSTLLPSSSIPDLLPTDTPVPTPAAISSPPVGTPVGIELSGFMDDSKATEQWRGGPSWSGDISYDYQGGAVLLAGSADGTVPIQDLDDALRLTVTHPDGTTAQFYVDTTGISCTKNQCDLGPYDITDLFVTGTNQVKTEIIDLWPTAWGIKELWLVTFN